MHVDANGKVHAASVAFTLSVDHPQFGAVLALLMGTTAPAALAPPAPLGVPVAGPMPAGDDEDDGVIPGAPATDVTGIVDSAGLPWDERIHASSRAINKGDGKWRARKGVDAAIVPAVEAELRARQPVPPPPPVTMAPPMPVPVVPLAPAAPLAPPPPPVTMAPPAPLAPAMPVPPPPPVAVAPEPVTLPQPSDTLDFPTFFGGLSEMMKRTDVDGTITGTIGAKLIDAPYLADRTAEINTAFMNAGQITAPLNAITDAGGLGDPALVGRVLSYAIQLFTRDRRWS